MSAVGRRFVSRRVEFVRCASIGRKPDRESSRCIQAESRLAVVSSVLAFATQCVAAFARVDFASSVLVFVRASRAADADLLRTRFRFVTRQLVASFISATLCLAGCRRRIASLFWQSWCAVAFVSLFAAHTPRSARRR